jgi:hypothetical protein
VRTLLLMVGDGSMKKGLLMLLGGVVFYLFLLAGMAVAGFYVLLWTLSTLGEWLGF